MEKSQDKSDELSTICELALNFPPKNQFPNLTPFRGMSNYDFGSKNTQNTAWRSIWRRVVASETELAPICTRMPRMQIRLSTRTKWRDNGKVTRQK
jgi:hypothetical protein